MYTEPPPFGAMNPRRAWARNFLCPMRGKMKFVIWSTGTERIGQLGAEYED